jgi:hypothetical protein
VLVLGVGSQHVIEQASATLVQKRADTLLVTAGPTLTDLRFVIVKLAARAKDHNGNPVFMTISPDSVTEVSDLEPQRRQ